MTYEDFIEKIKMRMHEDMGCDLDCIRFYPEGFTSDDPIEMEWIKVSNMRNIGGDPPRVQRDILLMKAPIGEKCFELLWIASRQMYECEQKYGFDTAFKIIRDKRDKGKAIWVKRNENKDVRDKHEENKDTEVGIKRIEARVSVDNEGTLDPPMLITEMNLADYYVQKILSDYRRVVKISETITAGDSYIAIVDFMEKLIPTYKKLKVNGNISDEYLRMRELAASNREDEEVIPILLGKAEMPER